jgi:hypothetical protein
VRHGRVDTGAQATLLLSALTGALALVWWRYGENHTVWAAT